jgi:hypothetical protein
MPRRVLLLLVGDADPIAVREALAEGRPGPLRVHVVAPAQVRPLDWFATADDRAQQAAEVRVLEAEWTLAEEAEVEGGAGDVDALQAVEDALRGFAADEILVAGSGAGPGLEEALTRFGLPVARVGPAPAPAGLLRRTYEGLAAGRSDVVPFAVFVGVNTALLLLSILLALIVGLIVWLFF